MKTLMQIPLWLLSAMCLALLPCENRGQDAAAATKKADPVAAFIWVDSVPSGAKVTFRGEKVGVTPLFVDGLNEGEYVVKITKKGYEPLEKTCQVPNDGNKITLQLKQQTGSCIIESVPTNASVFHGTQLVGRTPFAMAAGEILPGKHLFRICKVGYKTVKAPMDVSADEAANAKVALLPEMGTLKIKMIPATAELIIERKNYGCLNQLNEKTRRSVELVLSNMVVGKYRIMMQYAGQSSEIETVAVEEGKETTKNLYFWFPDTRITMADGSKVDIMTIEKDAKGNRVVLTKEMKLKTLNEAMVKKSSPIPEEEAASIVRKERILRKMRRREKNLNPQKQ